MWSSDKPPPARSRWPPIPNHVPFNILQSSSSSGTSNGNVGGVPESGRATRSEQTKSSISQRFYPHHLIQTAGVLSLDEDTMLTTDEVDFAFKVWRQFPDRIVGYPARSHYWDDAKVSSRKCVNSSLSPFEKPKCILTKHCWFSLLQHFTQIQTGTIQDIWALF